MVGDKRREDLAWAAGFFDGEGNTALSTPKKQNRYPQMAIQQSHPEVLEKFAAIVGGKVYGPYQHKNPNHRPYWSWRAWNSSVMLTVWLLWPWLGSEKREQAAMALDNAVITGMPQRRNRKANGTF